MSILELEYAFAKARLAAAQHKGVTYVHVMQHLRKWYEWRRASIIADSMIKRWRKDSARKPCG